MMNDLLNSTDFEQNEVGRITPISELDGAVKLRRQILVGNQPRSYDYYYQTKSGPCAALTFMNLWSLIHGQIPNLKDIDQGLINNGTSRKVWTQNFSLIHGNNPENSEFKFTLEFQNADSRQDKAAYLVDILDTVKNGSMVCGTQQHCNAIHKFNSDQYVLVEPNDLQGLKAMTKDETVDYISGRLTNDLDGKDYFYFIGPDINPDQGN